MVAIFCLLAAAAPPAPADEPLGNVRVTVTMRWEAVADHVGAAVRVGPGAAGVTARAGRSQPSGTAKQQLLVMSGGRASIRIAQEIPYSEWFWTWGLGRGLWV